MPLITLSGLTLLVQLLLLLFLFIYIFLLILLLLLLLLLLLILLIFTAYFKKYIHYKNIIISHSMVVLCI